MTTEAALGLIGGTMGLLTGFSILSGVNFLFVLIDIFLVIVEMNDSFLCLKNDLLSGVNMNCSLFLPELDFSRLRSSTTS